MGGFSLWHILIFAVSVLLLFGGKRFSNMMGDVAKGLKSFKQGMADEDEKKRRPTTAPPAAAAAASTVTARRRPSRRTG